MTGKQNGASLSLRVAIGVVVAFAVTKSIAAIHMVLVTTVLGPVVSPVASMIAALVDVGAYIGFLCAMVLLYRGKIDSEAGRIAFVFVLAYQLGGSASYYLATDTRGLRSVDLLFEASVQVALIAACLRILVFRGEAPNRS
jgi:hypothetical protein